MQTIKKAPTHRFAHFRPSRTALVGVLAVATVLGACAPRIDTRGNAIPIEEVAKVEPGKHTRDHVLSTLGSPSSHSAFGEEVWYYISERTETTAFLAPELKERQVIVVKFNEHGVVRTVDVVDEKSAEAVDPVDRKTPTAGNSLGVVEQLLSNIGRFNKNK